YMLDPEGIICSWNPGAERFKGYQADEIIGHHFSEFFTPEERAASVPQYALIQAAEHGKFESEGWRMRKDGSRFWAYTVLDAIRSPDGALLGYAKITRDLSDRRNVEVALRDSERQFRMLVDGVTDYAIYMLSPDGYIVSWNSGAERIKGYKKEEVLGSHFSRFYTSIDQAAGEPDRVLDTARREGRFESEGQRVRSDGTVFWAHVIVDAVYDEAGQLLGFAKITRDISQQREARESLLQMQKMEAIGHLTGGIAHDFNNLLMAIFASLELLKKRIPADQKQSIALLDNATLAAKRGGALTQRLLSFARRQVLKLESVDVQALVRGMADLLTRSLGEAMQVEIRFPLVLSPANCDANQLELALLNLMINARDAMSACGTIVLTAKEETISTSEALRPGKYVCISVIDTGVGMDRETLSRAIEPFFTTKGVGKGTGLGLSMVDGMAQQCGGQLLLRSSPGTGTTAEIWLPVANQQPVKVSRNISETTQPSTMHSMQILVVDDDPLVLRNTIALLEDAGHQVAGATGASEALQALQHSKFDLLITDHLMPMMTGAQLIEEIRRRKISLPVLIMTGYRELATDTVTNVSRLMKPFTQQQLLDAIRLAI
ncbi:MAG TPA: PAS domain S-box protein, partial [Steroidobacteraceae bacterium]|nr:PAS domain S-box protein [Steroidobacteraceae bacterium]